MTVFSRFWPRNTCDFLPTKKSVPKEQLLYSVQCTYEANATVCTRAHCNSWEACCVLYTLYILNIEFPRNCYKAAGETFLVQKSKIEISQQNWFPRNCYKAAGEKFLVQKSKIEISQQNWFLFYFQK